MDFLSILGVILAFAALLGGNLLEGGALGSLFNGPAALIVIGGTLAATILQTSWPILKRAAGISRWVFVPPYIGLEDGIDKVISWSVRARKQGLLGLEGLAEKEPEKFARKGLQLLVDGAEPESIRNIMEVDLDSREQSDLEAARVFEAMGGYSPTIGIIGAVMGLIQVMTNLEDPSTLGAGIATAFVATIYGVALANLLFFPVANKLRSIVRQRSRYEDMMIDGIIAIAEGENPRSIELRLRGFIQ
ncbi:MAG: flagellar motor protein [Alteromonadaceae bacterium]|uniref:flagellar motor protein n=1 Tax=unclassified Marinobacter TaxID=83889 RepID=UPI000C363BDB|nr:flagellar motor protein [Marinobacter sp. BGYM27]MAA63203.1 flagellar motor protein [Alteromonadaceae bacterium]MBH84193.1 flagellar motor protein [Alteromonadaceae bacterium]MDG5498615.1 flagellar motor protein [Marinobacter sp. BGYM27]|tara:strand:+ start:16794 stop:17534 length:741 start_codon:yes stop_codon:yes gene_type:complete